MTPRRLATTAVTVLLLAGCTGGGPQDHDATTDETSTAMQVMKKTDAQQTAKTLADSVAKTVGKPLEKWKTQPTPCENSAGVLATKGPWTLNAVANVAVPAADQVSTLARLHEQWKSQGYDISEYRLYPPDNKRGTVSARVPANNLTISVASNVPGTAFSIIIATPCYQPAPGENPGNE